MITKEKLTKRQEARKKFKENLRKELKKNRDREIQSIEYAKHAIKR